MHGDVASLDRGLYRGAVLRIAAAGIFELGVEDPGRLDRAVCRKFNYWGRALGGLIGDLADWRD